MEADFASFTNQLTALVVDQGTAAQNQKAIVRQKGVFQSFIFLILNLVRDTDFDKLPSYSLSKWEECKKLEISYFELKEFERTLGQQMVEG